MLTQEKKQFIEFMMSADVLRFGDFVTKSGRNTPYFINTGNYKTGLQSSKLGEFYASCIQNTVGDHFDAMFGPAYKGFRLQHLQRVLLPEITELINLSFSIGKKQKTTEKVVPWLVINRRTAIKLLLLRM